MTDSSSRGSQPEVTPDRRLISFLHAAIMEIAVEIAAHQSEVHPHVIGALMETMTMLKGQIMEWAETESPVMYEIQKAMLGMNEVAFVPEGWMEEVAPEFQQDEEDPDA